MAERIAGLNQARGRIHHSAGRVLLTASRLRGLSTGAQAKASGRFLDITETAYPMMGNARMLMSGSAGAMTVVSGEIPTIPHTRVAGCMAGP